MTANAQNEEYVKSRLRPRMDRSSAVIVLVGTKTKWLYKYVRWELELAVQLGLPIIAVSLEEKKQIDRTLCPAIIRDECVVHVPFKMKAIKYALDDWPAEYRSYNATEKAKGPRHYNDNVYRSLGL